MRYLEIGAVLVTTAVLAPLLVNYAVPIGLTAAIVVPEVFGGKIDLEMINSVAQGLGEWRNSIYAIAGIGSYLALRKFVRCAGEVWKDLRVSLESRYYDSFPGLWR